MIAVVARHCEPDQSQAKQSPNKVRKQFIWVAYPFNGNAENN